MPRAAAESEPHSIRKASLRRTTVSSCKSTVRRIRTGVPFPFSSTGYSSAKVRSRFRNSNGMCSSFHESFIVRTFLYVWVSMPDNGMRAFLPSCGRLPRQASAPVRDRLPPELRSRTRRPDNRESGPHIPGSTVSPPRRKN
ncbi:hypothetical protein SDC9_115471 [bioreactor metagenome]|uniref:Uncharacterized protein n=1 Tax=bioreactor metagenome TaxID=1076179 RepID=A0A645BTY7_9ZZZZ